MKKYRVYRFSGTVDDAVQKHELIAVEYGANIDAVADRLVQVVNEDAIGLPQYQQASTVWRMGRSESNPPPSVSDTTNM